MFTHFVIVEESGASQFTYFLNPEDRHSGMATLFVPDRDISINWESPFELGAGAESFFQNVKFVLCNSEANAKATAGKIAQHQPGRRVFYGATIGAAVAPPTDVTFQTITEKGILPS